MRPAFPITFVLFLAAVAPAGAYVRTRPPGKPQFLRFRQPTLELSLRTRELPAGWTREALRETLARAAARWSKPAIPCTSFQIRVRDQGADDAPGPLRDGVHSVSVYTRAFCSGGARTRSGCYDPRMAAVTTVHFGDVSADTVELAEVDIEVNAVSFRYPRGHAPLGAGALDLESVLVHELGHALGFDDSCRPGSAGRVLRDHLGHTVPECRAAPPAALRSVMFPAAQLPNQPARKKRALSPDDRAGVCALYP